MELFHKGNITEIKKTNISYIAINLTNDLNSLIYVTSNRDFIFVLPLYNYLFHTAEVSFETSIPFTSMNTSMKLGAESFYNIGSNERKKTGKTETWTVHYPSEIPSKSTLVLLKKNQRKEHYSNDKNEPNNIVNIKVTIFISQSIL